MGLFIVICILLGMCYALLPYYGLIVTLVGRDRRSSCISLSAALFTLCSAPVVAVSLHAYLCAHAGLCLVATILIVIRRPTGGWTPPSDWWLIVIAALAFLSRLAPPLIGGEPLGMGDARYHNLIAQALLIAGKTPTTWAPFADIGIMYPQAIHTLMAFVATVSHVPVHNVFVVAFAPVAAMTVMVIYRIAVQLTGSVAGGRLAAAAFAFLPTWNSLDYYAWGGLPNALGMVFLLEVIAITLKWIPTAGSAPRGPLPCDKPSDPGRGEAARPPPDRLPTAFYLLPASLLIAAIPATHHYTVLVTGLYVVSLWICCGSLKIRQQIMKLGLLSLVFGAYAILQHYVQFGESVGTTSVCVYREQITRLMDILQGLSIPLVIMFALTLLLRRRTWWAPDALTIFTWFISLLMAFVLLAYGYRVVTLWLTHGTDMFTSFTPSRMAATLVYPMSLLSSHIVLTPFWTRYRSSFILSVGLACLVMASTALNNQLRADEFPDVVDAGRWLTINSPTNAMLVGVVPDMEYTAWRETADPPLPASEQRNDPAVTWKRDMKTYAAWLTWQSTTRRPVYVLLPTHAQQPPRMVERYTNSTLSIYSTHP